MTDPLARLLNRLDAEGKRPRTPTDRRSVTLGSIHNNWKFACVRAICGSVGFLSL